MIIQENKYIKTLIIFLSYYFLNIFNAETFSQVPFIEIDTNFSSANLLVPTGMKVHNLFSEGEIVINNKNQKHPSKGYLSQVTFISSNNDNTQGLLYISHECNDTNKYLGDGAGGTLVKIKKIDDAWVTQSRYLNVDFSPVGNSCMNAGSLLAPNQKLIICENNQDSSNKQLYRKRKGIRDTANYNGIKRFQNMGWITEVDLEKKVATQKIFAMGRFAHESILMMPDSLTYYLTDNHVPSVFFKYISDSIQDLTIGKLFAFKQNHNDSLSNWIELPMSIDSLINIREVALNAGATIFMDLRGMCLVDQNIYIAEFGIDKFNVTKKSCLNGTIAHHLTNLNGTVNLPYGTILNYNSLNNNIDALLYGSKDTISGKTFNNPQTMSKFLIDQNTFLVFGEGNSNSENDELKKTKYIDESADLWWLNLSTVTPTLDDLSRFGLAPAGFSFKGGTFTPDFKTYFTSLNKNPVKGNQIKRRSNTLAITGFRDKIIRERKAKVKNVK